MLKRIIYCILIFLNVCIFSINSLASGSDESILKKPKKPLWELGLFNGLGRLPHYKGSDEYDTYFLPLPYFIYRGKVIQSDRDGVRGILFKTKTMESTISFFGNPPVDDDNKAREGMEELDPLIEMGPSIQLFLNNKNIDFKNYLKIALRGVFSIDNKFNFSYEGLHGGINFISIKKNFLSHKDLRLGVNLGVDFSNSQFNSYFYDVSMHDVSINRPYYKSKSGYGGLMVSTNLLKKINDNLSIGAYFKWENFNNAVFEDSPLLKDKNNYVMGLGLIWKIKTSKKYV